MFSKTAYIISLKFAPGLKKEFMVFGENIRERGINVKYLLSAEYAKLEDKCDSIEYITTADDVKGIILETFELICGRKFIQIFFVNPPIFLCFYNPHPLNPFIARLIKRKFPEAIIALYLHDPYKPDKKPYGRAKAVYITLVELIQALTVRYMNHIISPSEYSFQLFKSRYSRFKGKTHIVPLLIPDQREYSNKKRKFYSITGRIHLATGLDVFIELVNYAAAEGLDYEFAIISSSNISVYLKKLSETGRKILKVVNKKIISDSEIDEIVRESYAVFRLDREVTQSGVIPVSYMNATPIIARDIPGLRQHVRHKYNGYLVPYDCTYDELTKAINFIKENFDELSENARKSYEEIWAEWNWDEYYGWLINLLRTENLS